VQSTFIKKSIHGNLLYVKNYAKFLHKNNTPALRYKLDIWKDFYSVRRDYILELLEKGFSSRFQNRIGALHTTSSSQILLNGMAGLPIKHGQELQQGNPPSSLLFLLTIDPHSNPNLATYNGLLIRFMAVENALRTSLYVDDAAIFVAHFNDDIQNLTSILHDFDEVTRLCSNCQKSFVVSIRCA
jgi:hypothetical protein